VDLVKDDKFDISNQVGSLVQHTPQDLGRHLSVSSTYNHPSSSTQAHNQATTLGINLDISGQNTNRRWIERSFEISEFLIRQSLDRGRIDGPASVSPLLEARLSKNRNSLGHVLGGQGNSIFGHNRLAC
jgi:hypothetical protein